MHNWKLWYHFKTEIPYGDPDNLVRLFDLGVDQQEEKDVKDHYPWVFGIMDSIVNEYETSVVFWAQVNIESTPDFMIISAFLTLLREVPSVF